MTKKFFLVFLLVVLGLSFGQSQTAAMHNTEIIQPGSLIKASSNSVYYMGADGKRYVFPNQKTYNTWYIDFNLVVEISDQLLADLPIGGNVTYKPGKRLVKITTDPKVYWVDKEGTLRHLSSEAVAKQLFGQNWYSQIDDVPDAFFVNYKIGEPIDAPVLPNIATTYSINNDKALTTMPDPATNELSKINLTGKISGSSAILNWTVYNVYVPSGFKVVMGNNPDPVYPGNDYHYLSDGSATTDTWNDLSAGTYYFRVCQYIDGKCGIYSNNLALKVSGETTNTGNGSISLTASWSNDKLAVILQWKPINLYSYKGYKVVYSKNANPVYPGNEYHYLSDPNARSDKWEGIDPGTYHFRVCEYLGGKCGIYSNDVTLTIPVYDNSPYFHDNSEGAIILNGNYEASLDKVLLNWSVDKMYSELGYKVVYSSNPNPVYPGNEYHYLSDPNTRSDKWVGLEPGTYHFRVCEYLGGSCGIYSNDLTLTVQ